MSYSNANNSNNNTTIITPEHNNTISYVIHGNGADTFNSDGNTTHNKTIPNNFQYQPHYILSGAERNTISKDERKAGGER